MYIKLFSQKFEEINGKDACTPNMHLHHHLAECLLDYGPPYAFWCYSFERYNGMLGKFPTNQRNIEPQLMKKCLTLQELHSQQFPLTEKGFAEIIEKHLRPVSGGLLLSSSTSDDAQRMSQFSSPILRNGIDFKVNSMEVCLPPIKRVVIDSNELSLLESMYKLLYPNDTITPLNRFAKQSSRVSIRTELFGSKATSRENNIVICAHWHVGQNPATLPILETALPLAVGQIQYFLKHDLVVENDVVLKKENIFAFVRWYKKHALHHNWFGSTALVFYPEFEPDSPYSFLPIQLISSLCIYGNLELCFSDEGIPENCVVATPTTTKHNVM